MIARVLLFFIAVGFLSGCLEDKGTSSAIVIPPGGLIQLDMTTANKVGDNHYSLYLAEFIQEENKTKNLLDMTTDIKPDLVYKILPKGLVITNSAVVKVVMEYRSTPWYAIVFPDTVIKVDLDSTLVYNLLSSYSARALATYTPKEVTEITAAVTKFRKERMSLFGIADDFNPDLLYRFVRNGLSADPVFLTLLKSYQVNFDYDSDGNILADPYPFNIDNRAPILDEKATTKVVDQKVNEMDTLQMRATARDPDGDEVFYAWTFNGEMITSEDGVIKWKPDYDKGRLDPYVMTVILSDGGKITRVDWNVYVDNVNRRPEYSHSCTLAAVEGKEWVCKVSYKDPDGEKVSAKLNEIEDSGPLTINGQAVPYQVDDQNEIEIRWTPNNGDALKKSASLVLELTDESLGMTIATLNLTVTDSNQAPYLVGGTAGAKVVYNDPYEYDYCALEVPDGVPPYRFYVDFIDPDNLGTPAPSPADVITYTTSGTLNSYMTKVSEVAITGGLRVTYDWKPVHSVKTGTFIITLKDNHGGAASPVTLSFTALDRNTKPCLTTPNNTNISSTLNYLSAGVNYSITSSDKDGGSLWVEAFGFTANNSFELLKLLQDCSTTTPIVLKQNIAQTEPTFRKNAATLCLRPRYSTDFWDGAGYAIFTRSSALTGRPTTSTTIKKGTILTSTTAGFIQQYQTYMDVTVLPQDYILYVPVIALNTDAPAGKVTVTSLSGYTVTNASAIDLTGTVTFTRATATAVGTIPIGTIVKTAESSGTPFIPSIQFEVPADVSLPIGTYSVTVPVWRLITETTASTPLTITSWGSSSSADQTGFAFTAKSAVKLVNYNDSAYYPEPNFADTAKKFNVRAIDGDKPAANAINAFVDTLPTEAATLTVKNPSAFDLEGKVNFTRTSKTTSFTLPAGTKITTSIRTQYETLRDVTMAVNQTTVSDVWVRRINYIGSPASRDFTVNYTHFNTASKLLSDPLIQAYEGTDLTNGAIEVGDNASEIPSPFYSVTNYWYPLDRRDTYSYEIVASGTAPAGNWKTCREIGAYSATCNSCGPTSTSNYLSKYPASGRRYFNTNKCYLRYQPTAADLSGTFSFKLTVHENINRSQLGYNDTYVAKNTWTTNLTLVVNEINHAPILTNSSFASYGSGQGSTYTNPVDLGDYSEGLAGYFNIYTTDSNKGSELKTVNFDLDSQVYDLKTSTWRTRPAGLSVTVDKVEDLTATAGSKTTARISWTPTDEESKQFSGTAGLVIKMKIYDAKSSPDLSLTTYGYYKVRLVNKNQIPSISTMATDNKVKVFADTYVKKEFYLYDNDAYVPQGGTFSTLLTACRDSNGNALQHATLDSGNTDPYTCHATAATFATEVTTYDSTYDRNKNVSQCFVGGVLNTDLAVPKFSPVGSPEVVSGVLRQKYQMEWCPQRGHIGVYTGELDVNDNGDVDRDGLVLARAVSSTPVQLTIVAPVFLVSPRVNISNVPTHYMPQTAASMNDYPFRYEVIANNSQKNTLEYSLLNSPRACGQTNGMCIDSATGVITWVPNYLTDVTASGGVGSLVKVQVRDTVTGDVDAAHFYLNVQSALSPFEQPPVINSVIPSGTSVLVAEKTPMTFSVSASDPNANDTLFYRWYVNGELRDDEGSSYVFKPMDTDGSVDPDGSGPKKAGEFTIRVDVTDGNYTVSRSWDVKVRNTYLLGDSLFDLTSARTESLPQITPTGVTWVGEIPYGITVGNDYQDHLIIVGNYMSGVFTKHFLWDLLTINGTLTKPNGTLANPPWNFTEDLPWLTGTSTHRVAINPVGTGYDMLMTSQSARSGPFGLTTEALHIMNTDLTSLTLSGSNKCSGDCPTQLYTSSYYTDTRITAAMDSAYVFYASDAGNILYYDYLTPTNPTTVYSFGSSKITGMALNRSIDRLYVTTQQTSPSISHKIYVFNVAPARSSGVPTLVATLNVFDGVTGHEDCKPSDITYDSQTNQVYALLSGTGGVVTFPDGASVTPTTASMQFIGVNELNASPFDVPGSGRRLVIRADDRLLIGTMEGANQVFTIDLTDNHVYVSATQDPITSIASYTSGQILLISRSKGKVYKAK